MLRLSVVAIAAALSVSSQPTSFMMACWGGSSKDIPAAMAASAGTVFVVGNTYSDDYPVTVGHKLPGRWCAFATRLIADSGGVVYSTTVCSQGDVTARGAAIDGDGELWMGGTGGIGLPVTDDAAQRRYGGGTLEDSGDGLLVRMTHTDGALRYASYLGGSGDDAISAVVADGHGVWVAGHTASVDLMTSANALQKRASGGQDGFIAHVDSSGRLAHITYLGGNADDRITSMAMVDADRLALAGVTKSTSGPFGHSRGGEDGFVAMLNRTTKRLDWSARIGGMADEELRAVAVAKARIVAVGASRSPSCRGFAGARDGWVVTLSNAGVVHSDRCMGGTGNDEMHAVAAAADGTVWLTGVTDSGDFAFSRRVERSNYYSRALFARLTEDGTMQDAFVLGSEQLGSIAHSRGHAIAASRTGMLFVAGEGSGLEYAPTSGAFNAGQRLGSTDVFVKGLR
jgi:hypothetical protein